MNYSCLLNSQGLWIERYSSLEETDFFGVSFLNLRREENTHEMRWNEIYEENRAISEKYQLNRILINEGINNVEFLIKQLQILNVTWKFHTWSLSLSLLEKHSFWLSIITLFYVFNNKGLLLYDKNKFSKIFSHKYKPLAQE